MLRARDVFVVLSLAVLPIGCMPAGCGGEDPDVEEAEAMGAEESLTTAPKLAGTYIGPEDRIGEFARLVLMTDGRYHADRVVACIKAPCPPIPEDGTFKIYKREVDTYMALTPRDTEEVSRYQYVLRNPTLRMRRMESDLWNDLSLSNAAWCASSRDCTVQSLPPGPCAGTWTCGREACAWSCGAPQAEQ